MLCKENVKESKEVQVCCLDLHALLYRIGHKCLYDFTNWSKCSEDITVNSCETIVQTLETKFDRCYGINLYKAITKSFLSIKAMLGSRIKLFAWRSILMCNKSTSAGTSLEGTPMFAHVTLHRTFNPPGVSGKNNSSNWNLLHAVLFKKQIYQKYKMRKQLLKDHNFLNNSPIFIIKSCTFDIFAF